MRRKGKLTVTWYILGGVIVAIAIYVGVTVLRARKAIAPLTQEQFIQGYRKAQLIDLRESADFEAGHILGARNIPYTQFQHRHEEIRKDQPVYFYDQNGGRSTRAALFLKKRGYTDMYYLQGGFRNWTGRIKHGK